MSEGSTRVGKSTEIGGTCTISEGSNTVTTIEV